MPPERQQPQKRRRLPFKPPSIRETATPGPSTAAVPKPTASKAKKSSSTAKASSSKPKAVRKSTSSTRKQEQQPRPESPTSSASPSRSIASGSNADSDSASHTSQEPDYILAEITHNDKVDEDVTSSEPAIPPKLLTKLLHHHFKNEKTKLAKDANAVVAKYVDVFVREALARAAYEKAEGEGGSGAQTGDGFLEVEDLEKMAPQLILDF